MNCQFLFYPRGFTSSVANMGANATESTVSISLVTEREDCLFTVSQPVVICTYSQGAGAICISSIKAYGT